MNFQFTITDLTNPDGGSIQSTPFNRESNEKIVDFIKAFIYNKQNFECHANGLPAGKYTLKEIADLVIAKSQKNGRRVNTVIPVEVSVPAVGGSQLTIAKSQKQNKKLNSVIQREAQLPSIGGSKLLL